MTNEPMHILASLSHFSQASVSLCCKLAVWLCGCMALCGCRAQWYLVVFVSRTECYHATILKVVEKGGTGGISYLALHHQGHMAAA